MSDIINNEKEYEFLSTADGTIFDVCHKYYELFLKEEKDHNIASIKFSMLLCWDGPTAKTNKIPTIHSRETYIEKIEAIKDTTNIILGNLVKRNLEVNEFYLSLWDAINGTAFFATDLDTICAIIYLCNSTRIPYYKLDDGLKMDNEEFVKIAKDNIEHLNKMIYILSVGLEQKTEVASLLLQVLDGIEDPKTRVVLFAHLVSFCERRAVQLQKKANIDAKSEN